MSAPVFLAAEARLEKRRQTSAKHRRDYADQQFRKAIRARDQYCQAVGEWSVECFGPLQVCHFHGRAHRTVQFDPSNAVLLCMDHHRYFDTHPDIKWAWITRRLGEDELVALRARLDAEWDGDYTRVMAEIKALPWP